MPNRILKESICSSETIDGLSWFEEVFFYRLIVNCDDYGRMDARAKILKSRLFPLKDITSKQIEDAVDTLRTVGMIEVYVYDDRPYLQLRTWDKHQSIRAHKSKYPSPEESETICKQMQADASECPRNPIQSNPIRNPNTKGEQRTRFTPPTLDQVSEYCKERGNRVDPERFMDFYQSKGWKIGNQPMKDWKAAVRTWEKRSEAEKKQTSKSNPALAFPQREYDGIPIPDIIGEMEDG